MVIFFFFLRLVVMDFLVNSSDQRKVKDNKTLCTQFEQEVQDFQCIPECLQLDF